jgi:hypothetical protein
MVTTLRRPLEQVPNQFMKNRLLGEEVGTTEGQILDDEVHAIIGVLDTRDGDVSDALDDLRKDNFPDIIPELGFEGQFALRVEEKIAR